MLLRCPSGTVDRKYNSNRIIHVQVGDRTSSSRNNTAVTTLVLRLKYEFVRTMSLHKKILFNINYK